VAVTTEEKTCTKDTTVQQGLRALIGIIMAASGCPVLEHLRPLVRFHLPFARLSETVFRMASLSFLAQYFLSKKDTSVVWDFTNIEQIYADVGRVNRDFAQRIADTGEKDANLNALVYLDCFASMVPLAWEETLQDMIPSFSTYMKQQKKT